MRTSGLVVLLGLAAAAAGQGQSTNTRITEQSARSLSAVFGTPLASNLALTDTATTSTTYYLPHLAIGAGWQTTLTYVNYSPTPVTCTTTFAGDDGSPLQVPFTTPIPTQLGPGASFHVETNSTGGEVDGWGQAVCNGPIKASLLFRFYSGTTPLTEAGVNATTTPTTEFVTYAQSNTGLAIANPSPQTANITVNALDSNGVLVFTTLLVLNSNGHLSANLNGLTGAPANLNFTGSVQIVSDQPVLVLTLNAEKFFTLPGGGQFPVLSSLPPGDLPAGTALATGH